MNRRGFLKTIAAGAVAAIVPLPAPQLAVEKWVAKHGSLNPQTNFVRYYPETAFVTKPADVHKIWIGGTLVWVKRQPDQDPQP